MKGKYGRPCQFITGKNMSIGNMQPYQSFLGKVGYQVLNLHIENMHKLLKIIYHDYLVTESIDNFIKQNFIGQKENSIKFEVGKKNGGIETYKTVNKLFYSFTLFVFKSHMY